MNPSELKWGVARGVVLLVGICCLLFSASPAFPQASTGTILGIVKDTTGGTVAGATVTVTNVDTGFTRTGPTEDDGSYRFPQLPVGNYSVQVMKDGFQTVDRKGLKLEVTQEAAIDFTLQLGSTGQTVTVTEEAPLVDTTSSAVGGLVTEDKVIDLPLNGRNFTDLSLLQTGVTQNTAQGNVFGINGTFYSSNGAPTRSNNYLLDGALMQNIFGLNNASIAGTTLGVDGIKEYRVVTSMFSADYGLTMGSQTVIVSKGGTNGFHGSAFEYLRNSALDARNYFDVLDTNNVRGFGPDKSVTYPGKRIPPFQRNNFGASLGGPIRKDKTFFYGVYEGLRENKALSIADTTLPAACFPNGTTFFGVTTTLAPIGCGSTATAPVILTSVMQKLLTQTASGNPLPVASFPSGSIYPAPNASGAFTYSYPGIQRTGENYGQLRIDQNFSSSDSAFLRYTEDKTTQIYPEPFPQAVNPQSSLANFVTISETHILSPTLLNTARFSFSRSGYDIANTIVPGNTLESFVGGRPFGSISPGAGVTAFGGAGNESQTKQTVFITSDDIFWTKGRHNFKFGLLWDHWVSYFDAQYSVQGTLSFQSLPNFLTGVYSTASWAPLASSSIRNYTYNTLGFYGQDDLRVNSRLTLNLGLRYEFLATVPYENSGHNAEILNIATATAPNYGTLNQPFMTNPTLHNFSPRAGFAWDIFGDGKTALRGGLGIYYDVGNYGSQFGLNSLSTEPVSYRYNVAYSPTNPLVTPPAGMGLLDALAPAGGCAVVVNPTFPPCAPSTNLYQINGQPTLGQWNLTIDRQLPWDIGLTAGYIGSAGWHIYRAEEINPIVKTIDPNGNLIPLVYGANGLPIYCETPATATAGTCPQATTALIGNLENFQRLNPNLGTGASAFPNANTSYNSVQVVVNKRVSKGLQFQSSYTYGKSLDTGNSVFYSDGGTLAATAGNIAGVDRGPSVSDIRQVWRLNAIYAVPNIKSDKLWAKPLMGWNISGIYSTQTGYYLTPIMSGFRTISNNGGTANLPDRAASFSAASLVTRNPLEWFDPTMYALPATGVIGNAGRGSVEGPGLDNLNFSTSKDTKLRWLGEEGSILFRADFFNIFNHPNFAAPNTTVFATPTGAASATLAPGQFTPIGSSGSYAAYSLAGRITATAVSSRQIQLSLRISF